MVVAVLCVVTQACTGSVSGDVTTHNADTIQRLTGAKVYLVPATNATVTALTRACDSTSEWYERYRLEHERLRRAAKAHADSGVGRKTARSETERLRHLRTAAFYSDMLSRLPIAPPTEPDSLVAGVAEDSTALDSKGHFEFRGVPPGQYFVVAAGLGWKHAVVGRSRARLNFHLGSLLAGCSALAKA